MAGFANMIIGGGLAAGAWALATFPVTLPDRLTAAQPALDWVMRNGVETGAGLWAGAAVAAIGFIQLLVSSLGAAASAVRTGPKTADARTVDAVFLRVTAAMAGADGRAAKEEVAMFRALALRFRGIEIPAARAKTLIGAAGADVKRLIGDVRREAKGIPDEAKDQIVCAALWIALSDLHRHGHELKLLDDVANAIDLAPTRLEAAKSNVEAAARTLVAAAAQGPAGEPVVRPGLAAADPRQA